MSAIYRIRIDSRRCQGHARCLAFLPDTVDFDDEGYAYVPEEKSCRAEMTDALRQAAANCPERAFQVVAEE
ncbi:ferredoxin [Streptomyces sp. NPDC098789]|uniref:ferredoxin n=1 Tax=Streptomyces sp. NPDC098789 TaxID=3366098 RepID=UPI003819B4F0